MKKTKLLKTLLAAVLLVGVLPVSAQLVSSNNEDEVNKVDERAARNAYRPGEVIVKFKETSSIKMRKNAKGKFQSSGVSKVDQLFNAIGVIEADQLMPLTGHQVSRRVMRSYTGDPVKDTNLSGLYRLRMDPTAATSVEDAVNQLKGLEVVEYAEPNYLVFAMADNSAVYTAEPLYDQQWGPAAINLPQLWDMPLLEGATRPIIAILDTGIDIEHPDLAANIWTNAAENSGAEGEDDDNNGFADDVHGWDFINHTAKIADYNGHGTHCAGIAAAVGNNGIGITGANPDAYIMPITIMQSDGTGDVATIIQGIDYATANGAEFLSMSFGGYAYSIAEEQALAKAYSKATLVAAAGNDGRCIYTNHHQLGPGPCYPAAFTFVLGVEAANESGRAGFSNYDCDGRVYSMLWALEGSSITVIENSEERLHNYELRAPGVNIYSTYPKGRYKVMNGTSMACPLAAGAISRLMQCKSYEYQVINREILFGDLIHGANPQTGIMDVLAAYNIKDEDRVPTLWLVSTELNDVAVGDGDFRPDAGEIIDFYPILRNDWGNATNIRCHLGVGENEDETIIECLTNDVDFGHNLSSYGKAKSENPIRFKIADNCSDNRHIRLSVSVTCDELSEPIIYNNIVIVVENGIELGGVINEDMTLYPNKHYIVTKSIAIPEGKTLTIMPGTRLEFYQNCCVQSEGKLIANGKPDSLIVFTTHNSANSWNGLYCSHYDTDNVQDTISYSIIENINCNWPQLYNMHVNNCRLSFIYNGVGEWSFWETGHKNIYIDSEIPCEGYHVKGRFNNYVNFINLATTSSRNWSYCEHYYSNIINSGSNHKWSLPGFVTEFTIMAVGRDLGITTDHAMYPSWLGTSKEDIIRPFVYDSQNPKVDCFTTVDLSNMPTRPIREAHGLVWKVVVDGYDAQDEFAEMPPLGVGRHKFEVYYNRDDMDTTFTPTLSMGVRPPYTQIGISDGGYWSIKDSVSVYTAFLNITGKLQADGMNRIRVMGGKDYDHFDIPDEYWRFNVLVQAAGSMATGFAAEAGLGRVDLTWNNEHNDFEDAMGFNVYRFQLNENNDTINKVRINETIIDLEETEYTDFDVVPGQCYYYYYKVLSTDLKEYDISNIVTATPLTATLGDANASGYVDVADVITTVNYAAGMEPKPFIFGAADVNADEEIDILDVIGIIKIIKNQYSPNTASVEAVAEYSIEDGIVYVDCPVDLAGVQLMLTADPDATITATEALNGFEQVGAWMDENSYLFMAYNMNGKTIPAGKHAILNIGDADITDIRLSDKDGHNVLAVPAVPTVVDRVTVDLLPALQGVYDMMGRKVANDAAALPRLQPGIYIVNGKKMVVR